MKVKLHLFIIVGILGLIISGCSGQISGDSDSDKANSSYGADVMNVVIPFGPGGGTDLYIRKVVEIIQEYELYDGNIQLENREGGSGATGYSFLQSKEGDPYYMGPTAASFFTTPLMSDTSYNYDSFTPIALMGADDLFLLVKADSEYETLDEFIEAAKNDKRMKIGGVGQVSDEMIVPTTFSEEAGFEFDYVPFQGAGELTSALTSDSLDAIVGNPARSLGQIEGNIMKPLAFSGVERFPELPDVPTFIELGYDVNLSQPRGIILPADVDQEVVDFWVDAMKQVAETEEWKAYVEDNGMSDYTLFGEDFAQFLEETNGKFENALTNLE